MMRFCIGFLIVVFFTSHCDAMVVPKVIKTPGGLTAWYVHDENTPVISMHFTFKGGARLDPEGKAGVADITSDLLSSGTMEKDNNAFDAYKQDYAIQLDFSADSDQLGGGLTTLVQYKDKAFDLLHEVITSPRLKDDIFNTTMDQATTALANASHEPSYLAKRSLEKMLFSGHPYQNPSEGTPESIKKITLKDIGAFIKENLTKDRLLISINGNITEAEAISMLDKTFGSLPDKGSKPLDSRFVPNVKGQTEIIDLKIPQSLIFFVLPGVMYDDPDFLKAALMMHIMGEEQASRLFREVREKHGLAYAVGASNSWRQETGLINGMVGTTKDKAAQSIEILKQEWARLKKDGITAEELENAKTYMLNQYPLNFSNSGAISKILLGYQLVHRPIDYFQKREQWIKAITLKEMNDFIAKTIQPEKLTFVIVGRPNEPVAQKEEMKPAA
jgi:zinc protease